MPMIGGEDLQEKNIIKTAQVIVAASEKKLKEKFVYCMIFILFQKTF
jgi:hypothetical protein